MKAAETGKRADVKAATASIKRQLHFRRVLMPED